MRDIYTERFGKELLRFLEDREKLDKLIKRVEAINTKESRELCSRLYIISDYIDMLSKRVYHAKKKLK